MKEVEYEAIVIKAHALVLYRQAARMAIWSAIKGAAGWFAAAVLLLATVGTFEVLRDSLDARGVRAGDASMLMVIMPIIGAARGWSRGRERGWRMRLEAQRALCQVKIEEHLKRIAG